MEEWWVDTEKWRQEKARTREKDLSKRGGGRGMMVERARSYEKERHRLKRYRETERQTDRQTQRDTDRDIDRDTESHRERERVRERERESTGPAQSASLVCFHAAVHCHVTPKMSSKHFDLSSGRQQLPV